MGDNSEFLMDYSDSDPGDWGSSDDWWGGTL